MGTPDFQGKPRFQRSGSAAHFFLLGMLVQIRRAEACPRRDLLVSLSRRELPIGEPRRPSTLEEFSALAGVQKGPPAHRMRVQDASGE